MAPYTLDQPVKPNDLILLSKPRYTEMLFVKSTSSGSETTAPDSVTVKPIAWRIPIDKGYWTLDGPDVRYWPEEEEEGCGGPPAEEDEYAIYDEYNHGVWGECKLSWFLSCFDPIRKENAGKGPHTTVIVNPHGRDVLKYYFNGQCPECDGVTWVCQGCGGFSHRFPELSGGCANNLACPHCMGFDFACDEWAIIRDRDELFSHMRELKRSSETEAELRESRQAVKEEFLALSRERYELINARKAEMGFQLEDVDELMGSAEKLFK